MTMGFADTVSLSVSALPTAGAATATSMHTLASHHLIAIYWPI